MSTGVVGGGERGSAVLVALLAVAAAILCGALLVALQLGVLRHRAAAAADAAAVAAADVLRGIAPGAPCRSAARVAAAHGAELAACSVHGFDVSVMIRLAAPTGAIGARARAGPP